MIKITLGWDSSDQLSGALRELSEKRPNNVPLKMLYQAVASGMDEPVTIIFDDDHNDEN